LERNGNFYYYHQDGVGSVTAITDASRQKVQSYSYDSFGKITPQTNFQNCYGFTGREYDPQTGLYYYRARYYDPMDGRFISKDPISFAGGINLYSYVGGNPVSFVDPLGLATCSCSGKGNALSPGTYQTLGKIAGISVWIAPPIGLYNSALLTAQFYRGGLLDAQIRYGGSPAYANYVFGVYMSAMGSSLSQTLLAADAYGAFFSHYSPKVPMSPSYPNIPASNVTNITQGFKDEANGTLCH